MNPNLYETDFNLWIEQTVNRLQNGQIQDLDLENLIEEIQSMGRSDKREIYSRLKVLLIHLLKWKYQPQKRSNSWELTIDEQRDQIKLVIKDSPSLQPYFKENLADCYQDAIRKAAKETGLGKNVFPLECPFTQDQILDPDYFPDV
ncbi:MAG: DUF29 domain-containing protein [Synechocystis sp.]|nr:DUF29 domain-containing protein [Synechocystis sp.]